MINLRVNNRMSLSEIADQVGLDRSTVADHVKEYPLTVDEAKEIHRRKVKGRKYVRIDLTGQKFNRLLAVRVDHTPTKMHDTRWVCECDCGNTTIVASHNLRHGKVKSCGCLATDSARERMQKDPRVVNVRAVICKYKRAARLRNLAFSLSDEQCEHLFSQPCFYCGSPPDKLMQYHKNVSAPGRDFVFQYCGIDRVDSSLGYTRDNCVPCCTQCNYAKVDYTFDEFMTWVSKIYNFWHGENKK